MWVALSLKKQAEVGMLGRSASIPIKDMADGCVGCLLVFESREAATEYVGDGGRIVQVEITDGGSQ